MKATLATDKFPPRYRQFGNRVSNLKGFLPVFQKR